MDRSNEVDPNWWWLIVVLVVGGLLAWPTDRNDTRETCIAYNICE